MGQLDRQHRLRAELLQHETPLHHPRHRHLCLNDIRASLQFQWNGHFGEAMEVLINTLPSHETRVLHAIYMTLLHQSEELIANLPALPARNPDTMLLIVAVPRLDYFNLWLKSLEISIFACIVDQTFHNTPDVTH